jgi:hypothetical protein
MNFFKRLMKNPGLRQGVTAANPMAGFALNTIASLLSINRNVVNKEVEQLVRWIDARADKMMAQCADSKLSPKRRKEIEIRLHETLDMLNDIGKGKPWEDGGRK